MKRNIINILKSMMFVMFFIGSYRKLMAHDIITHMYISSKTYDMWQDFDPDFYNALIHDSDSDSLGVVRQFYLIGTTLPDLLDLEAQAGIRALLNHLYEHRSDFELGGCRPPFYIYDTTISLVTSSMEFRGKFPNKNLSKLYEMVLYARDHYTNWDKALIYGAYAHVVEDLFAHMVQQPAIFGYGKSIESDSVLREDMPIETHIMHIPEKWEEMFTPTYIDDWSFVKDVWVLRQVLKVGDTYIMQRGWKQPGAYEFASFVDRETGRLLNGQETDFYLVKNRCEKFVEAAQAVGYAGSNLTAERMSAYLYGWGLSLFYFAGYTDPTDQTDIGGIYGHPYWGFDTIKSYIKDITFYPYPDTVYIPIQTINSILNTIFKILNFIQDSIVKNYPALPYVNIGAQIGELARRFPGVPWINFYQNVAWFDSMWSTVADTIKSRPDVNRDYHVYRREIEYWNNYSSYKNPALRETYKNELKNALKFAPLYRACVNNGPDWFDYTMNKSGYVLDEFVLMRKGGPFGGLFDINSDDFYEQPGIIDMHFEKDGRYVYTSQEIPLEGDDGSFSLSYDVITFGDTKIRISKADDPQHFIKSTYIPRVDREQGRISVPYTELCDSLYPSADTSERELSFVVLTKDTVSDAFGIMLNSNYRHAFERPEVRNNRYYDSLFVHGEPVRSENQDPLANPKLYWPYTIKVKPTLTSLNYPLILNSEYNPDNNTVLTTIQDRSKYNNIFEVRRYDIERHTNRIFTISDTGSTGATYTVSDSGLRSHAEFVYFAKSKNTEYNLTSRERYRYVITSPSIESDNTDYSAGKRFMLYNGKYILTYIKDGRVYYAESSDRTHFTTMIVSGSLTGCSFPAMDANENGIVIVFKKDADIYMVKNTQNGWSSPIKIDDVIFNNDRVSAPDIKLRHDSIFIVYGEHRAGKDIQKDNTLTLRVLSFDGQVNLTLYTCLSNDILSYVNIDGNNTLRIVGTEKNDGYKIKMYKISGSNIGPVFEREIGYGYNVMMRYQDGYYYVSWIEAQEVGEAGEIKTGYVYGDDWSRAISTGKIVAYPTYPCIAPSGNGKWWIIYESWDDIMPINAIRMTRSGVYAVREVLKGYEGNLIGTYPQAMISEVNYWGSIRAYLKMILNVGENKKTYYFEKTLSNNVSPYTGDIKVTDAPLMIKGNILNGSRTDIWYLGHAGKKIEISLYRIDGSMVKTIDKRTVEENGKYRCTLNTSGLKDGIYYVVLKEDDSVLSRKKILVTK